MIISSWIFSRWMALIYLIAFWSLGVQILGLIGSHGILPTGDFLHYIAQDQGASRFWAAPTLCWVNNSDGFLLFLCWGGVALSMLLLIGVWPALTAFLLWIFYMSLTVVGQDFLGFQWDNLLLEAGFLLIFLVPHPFRIHLKPAVRPSIVIIWLFRWLLFRLMFESGMVKILSGDTNWAHLTALTYHYWTQPLPNMISWYANQLPLWFQKLSCAILLGIELFIPFLIFFGRWPRLIAFFGITGLQLLIILTGNYCFFNLLAIGLCLTLLEDEHFKFLGLELPTPEYKNATLMPDVISSPASSNESNLSSPKAFVGDPDKNISLPLVGSPAASAACRHQIWNSISSVREGGIIYLILTGLVAALILIVSLGLMLDSFAHLPLPNPVEKLITAVSPLRSINNYGLFAVMTTQRDEIVLEGSNDGEQWLPYEFYFKPGNVNFAPSWVMPYQPRLDWQMWFAALGSWRENQWLMVLMERLLQGEPSVTRLLSVNPFKDHPPQYIQATFWEYHFTDFKTKGPNGPWWHREIKGLYCPTVSLRAYN